VAKIVRKRKRKKIRLARFSAFLFFFSAVLYLISSLFLRTYNNQLCVEVQTINDQISQKQAANDQTKIDIERMTSKDRVYTIASDNNLKYNADAVITISDSAKSGQ
jgi:cell division protein FtsL